MALKPTSKLNLDESRVSTPKQANTIKYRCAKPDSRPRVSNANDRNQQC